MSLKVPKDMVGKKAAVLAVDHKLWRHRDVAGARAGCRCELPLGSAQFLRNWLAGRPVSRCDYSFFPLTT